MNNKKILIIVILILLIIAIIFGIFKATYNSNYIYNEDGTISNGYDELIEHLKSIEDEQERKDTVDYYVEQNIITQEVANDIY